MKCLQFDALHIVSGGSDASLCITDIATGDVIQTIRAHQNNQFNENEENTSTKNKSKNESKNGEEIKKKISNQVLAVAFDMSRIISAGTDNNLRYWEWGKKTGPQDKHHVLDKGQTLVTVSKLHNVPVDDLMKWNGIIEMRQAFEGMRLIVRKGDPDEQTHAEKMAKERENRKIASSTVSVKKKKSLDQKSPGAGLALKSRVERSATDGNKTSMSNRMSSKAKADCELFPDPADTYKDPQTLNSRIARQRSAGDGLKYEIKADKEDYHIRPANESEWGPVSDSLAIAMLNMLVEYEAYEVAKSVRSLPRENMSMMGRMHANAERLRIEKEKADKETEKKAEKERDLMITSAQTGKDVGVDVGVGVTSLVSADLDPDPNTDLDPDMEYLHSSMDALDSHSSHTHTHSNNMEVITEDEGEDDSLIISKTDIHS